MNFVKAQAGTVKKIELNNGFRNALDILEHSDKHAFITGKAGTGKSTFLEYFRSITKKNIVVLAPTGVAALNVRGQTIHSFFKFKPDITLDAVKKIAQRFLKNKTYTKLEAIVIDEISMVRADLLDCVDQFLRITSKNKHKPFGGIQMIFIGDLYQLPPVVTSREKGLFKDYYSGPYFFNARAIDEIEMEFIELEKVYRQKDAAFIHLLNSIRNNSIDEEKLRLLNKRYSEDFVGRLDDFYIYLTTTNDVAERINHEQLSRLRGEACVFTGEVSGDFDVRSVPTPIELSVKVGAQVMLLNNDSRGRFVNGTIGHIVGIEENEDDETIILVERDDGAIVEVAPYTWEMFRFSYDKNSRGIQAEAIGTYCQYPLKLAWAVTIHKSQGKTFDKVIIDIGRGTFTHGQMYVALSRCTSFEGIILKQQIQKKHIFMDFQVVRFLTRYRYNLSDKAIPLEEKIQIIKEAIRKKRSIDIVYLKSNDEKSQRIIQPFSVGTMDYNGKSFIGVQGYCALRKEERVFRVDRILEMRCDQ